MGGWVRRAHLNSPPASEFPTNYYFRFTTTYCQHCEVGKLERWAFTVSGDRAACECVWVHIEYSKLVISVPVSLSTKERIAGCGQRRAGEILHCRDCEGADLPAVPGRSPLQLHGELFFLSRKFIAPSIEMAVSLHMCGRGRRGGGGLFCFNGSLRLFRWFR